MKGVPWYRDDSIGSSLLIIPNGIVAVGSFP